MSTPNPFLLAADNSPALLPLLREHPHLASEQDEHGYSLVHAAASYNHLDLLRALVREFSAPVNMRDEDGETALFVVETIEAARVLVEELNIDINIIGAEGLTAAEKIEVEGDYPDIVEYLRARGGHRGRPATGDDVFLAGETSAVNGTGSNGGGRDTAAPPIELPPVPEGLAVSVGTAADPGPVPDDVDPEFRARIEALAAREDFHTAQGQAELRQLVEDAISRQDLAEDRNVRPRQN